MKIIRFFSIIVLCLFFPLILIFINEDMFVQSVKLPKNYIHDLLSVSLIQDSVELLEYDRHCFRC